MTTYERTRFHKATVVENNDPLKSGKILVSCPEISENLVEIIYTSPFFTQNGGGMIAIPEVGSKILVYYDFDNREMYYITTIVAQPENNQNGGLVDYRLIKDKYVYSGGDKPKKVNFTNSFGAGLEVARFYEKEYITNKVELKSEIGKKVILSDSPNMDAVIVRNEHGDGVTITSDPTNVHGERAIEIKSKGMQRYVVFQSDMNLLVVDGRDINIENYSTGAFANSNTVGKFGNINLRSYHADINIISKAEDGRIFLITPKARIQIEDDGSILIESDGDIQLASKGDIDVKADNAIRIEAQTLDIKTVSDIRLESGGSFSSKSVLTNSLDGDQVHFNSGLSQTAVPTQIKDPDVNDYSE